MALPKDRDSIPHNFGFVFFFLLIIRCEVWVYTHWTKCLEEYSDV